MSDSKEKIGNTINQLDLLHRLFINHVDYGGHPVPWIRDDLRVVWRGMEDPPPKLPWPSEAGEDVEVEEYTSPSPHETKTISKRFVGRDLVGVVRGLCSPPVCLCGYVPRRLQRTSRQTRCRRSDYYTYLPLGCGSKTPLIYLRLPQRPEGLPALISQSALRLSITTSLLVSSSHRSRKSSSSSG